MNCAFKSLSMVVLWSLALGIAAAQETPPAAKPAADAQAEAGEPRANTNPTPAAASPTPPQPSAGSRLPRARDPKVAGSTGDRLDLSTSTVTGDREQPKVMYIVPWKKSNIGDLSGKPMNSLLDEALAPVDRDEFKREVVYFNALNADAPQNGAQKPAAKQGEK